MLGARLSIRFHHQTDQGIDQRIEDDMLGNEFGTVHDVALPGGREGRSDRQKLFTFSIIVTGRCNVACTYCHYYLARNRAAVEYDLPDAQFDAYLQFIGLWRKAVGGYVQYRFSGGDPMVLGKRLFTLADRGFEVTGLKPFILTAGKALSPRWVEQAQKHSISHVFVSIENPFAPDPGAPDPVKVARAIKQSHSESLPILPGVCVVQNKDFVRLYDICCWFFEKLGKIPVISECNYAAYVPPTETEWSALQQNIERVIQTFYGKTPLKLFPYVSPELAYGGNDPYVFDLDLENKYGMTLQNYEAKLQEFLVRLDGSNYPVLECPEKACHWWEFCDNTKWFWQGDRQNGSVLKLRDYCRFKRLLNDAYYRQLVDCTHPDTREAIDAVAYVDRHGARMENFRRLPVVAT